MKHAFMSHARKPSRCKDKISGGKFSVELQFTVLWFKDYVSCIIFVTKAMCTFIFNVPTRRSNQG